MRPPRLASPPVRRTLILGLMVLPLVHVPLAGLAVSSPERAGGAHINCMATSTLDDPVTTTKTTFTEVSDLRMSIQAVWTVTASVTVVVTGGPIRLKAVDTSGGGALEMSPGVVTLDPGVGETNTFSLTFVGENLPRFGTQGLRVKWRVLHAGDSATIVRAAATLIYETETCPFM